MTGSDAFLTRWAFVFVCRGCGAQIEMNQPNVGLEVMPGFTRLVVMRVPEVCPDCRSLQLVGAPPAAKETAEEPGEPEGPASA